MPFERQTRKAINHFEAALSIASSYDWHDHLFWTHCSLARLFFDRSKSDEAHAYVERAKSYVVNDRYMGRAMAFQARFWHEQRILKAKSEALRATDIYERTGFTRDTERCRTLLRDIEEAASHESDFNGGLLETVLLSALVNSSFSARGTQHHLTSLFRRIRPRATGPTSRWISHS